MPHRTRSMGGFLSNNMNPKDQLIPGNGEFPLPDHLPMPKPESDVNQPLMYHPTQFSSMSSSSDSFSRPSLVSESSKSSTSSTEDQFVRLARRRATKSIKERASQRKSTLSRPQGRPLSKETRVRLTLVPTMGILYSILVSDTMRKQLSVVKYSSEPNSVARTNDEMSTKNVVSGFSSMLNVQSARFSDDPTVSPDKNSAVPQFRTIDDAVYSLFGLTEYSLIRVTRAAATEVGGSVLLKIETAMPGYLFLNDDEEDDFNDIEMNRELYQETIGNLGDRPTTTFLKKRVARPRYKSDMRIYLIPRSINCAIYCEKRIFKRDLLRGFLDFAKGDRSLIVGFDYADALRDLQNEGNHDVFDRFGVPSVEQVEEIHKSIQEATAAESSAASSMYPGYHMPTATANGSSSSSSSLTPSGAPRSSIYGGLMRPQGDPSSGQVGGLSMYDHSMPYISQPPQGYQLSMPQPQQTPFGYPTLVSGYPPQPGHSQTSPHSQPQHHSGPPPGAPVPQGVYEPQHQQQSMHLGPGMMSQPQTESMYFTGSQPQQHQRVPSYPFIHGGAAGMPSAGSGQWVDPYGQPTGPLPPPQQQQQQQHHQQHQQQQMQHQQQQQQQQPLQQSYYPPMDGYTMQMAPPSQGSFNGGNGSV